LDSYVNQQKIASGSNRIFDWQMRGWRSNASLVFITCQQSAWPC